MTTREFQTTLRSAGLRVTRPRVAVLEALSRCPHSDTDQVISLVRAGGTAVSHQGVYDVLHALTHAGVLRRIQTAGTNVRYEVETKDNHHHLACRSCGALVDVDRVLGEAACLRTRDDQTFAIDQTEVVFWGVCPTCHQSEE